MTRCSKGATFITAFVLASGIWTIARAQVVQPGPRMAQGWVVGVQARNGQGIFQIRTGSGNNNFAAGVNQARGGATQQFTVGPATTFDAVGPRGRVPASFASLRPGQRVMVQAQGPQAIGVRIFPHNQYAGTSGRGNYVRAVRTSTSAARTTKPFVPHTSRNVSTTHAAHGSGHRR